MKTTKKKPSAVRETFPAPIVASGPTLFHPEFRAFTQGRMPFPHEIDFYAMLDAESWLYEYQLELQEEIEALGKELVEAIQELNLLRMPVDCHADEKALALLLSIGNGRFVQDLYEAMQTAMFDMAVRLDGDEKWVVNAKLTATLDKHNHNKADIAGEVKAVIPAVACSGAVYIDGAGNLMTPKEAVKQLSMFQYDARRAA
jgi:hypothetical protein